MYRIGEILVAKAESKTGRATQAITLPSCEQGRCVAVSS